MAQREEESIFMTLFRFRPGNLYFFYCFFRSNKRRAEPDSLTAIFMPITMHVKEEVPADVIKSELDVQTTF